MPTPAGGSRTGARAALYVRAVTLPLSALPSVQARLAAVDAEVHRLAAGSVVPGMDTATRHLLATGVRPDLFIDCRGRLDDPTALTSLIESFYLNDVSAETERLAV